MNVVWFGMIALSFAVAAWRGGGRVDALTAAAMRGASEAVTFTFALIGVIALWSGLMKIAERSGLTRSLARALAPLGRLLFPSVPADHPAMGAVLMSMSANVLGLGNAATPLGLKAMHELQRLNHRPDEASDAMCTFLALSTSSLTLVPGAVVALRAAEGSADPAGIIGPTLIATLCSTAVALAADALLRKLPPRGPLTRRPPQGRGRRC